MSYGGLCTFDVNDMWGLFESLAWYQWQHESASESFVCRSPIPYGLHSQSPCADQFGDSFHYHPSYSPIMCQSFDHYVNSCPYSDISDELYARLKP